MGILDAPPRNTKTRIPCASRALGSPQNNTLSDGIVTAGTFRIQHAMLVTAHDLTLTFANSYNNNGVDTDGLNDITVRASIETTNTDLTPVFFKGARDVVIKPGAKATCDPIGVTMAAGTLFWTRTYVQVPGSGDKWQLNLLATIAANEGDNRAVAAADLTLSGTVGSNALRGYTPVRIDGIPKFANQTVVGIVGDSIAAGTGTGDQDVGFILRALNGAYAYQSVARSSEGPNRWGTDSIRHRRYALLDGATVAITNHGINAISATLAVMQVQILTLWNVLAQKGIPVYQTTITPSTTSTDAWATTANQTVTANESKRTGFNDWLRDGAPIVAGVAVAVGVNPAVRAGQATHPLTAVFEVADLAETARNSGKWKSVGSGVAAAYTADGLHPTDTAAIAMAAGITPTVFGPVAQ